MVARTVPDDAPLEFQRALEAVRTAVVRPDVVLAEAPAPQRIAPYSVALTGEVVDRRGVLAGGAASAQGGEATAGEPEELANGRFVLLHDPSSPAPWGGTFRAVTFVRADLEPEMGADPMLGAVGWSWLVDALHERHAAYRNEGGTVTRVVAESFAGLAERGSGVSIEIRASWTPVDGDLAAHLLAWTDLLCTVAGLPPLPDGVSALPGRRS